MDLTKRTAFHGEVGVPGISLPALVKSAKMRTLAIPTAWYFDNVDASTVMPTRWLSQPAKNVESEKVFQKDFWSRARHYLVLCGDSCGVSVEIQGTCPGCDQNLTVSYSFFHNYWMSFKPFPPVTSQRPSSESPSTGEQCWANSYFDCWWIWLIIVLIIIIVSFLSDKYL